MKLLSYIFIAFAVIFSLFTLLRIFFTFSLFDFVNVYYPSIQDLLHHKNIYDNTATDVNYPPTTFLFLFPFGFLPIDVAQKIWIILSFSSLLGTIFLFFKTLDKNKFPIITSLLIYSFAMLSFPFKFTFGMGQVNLLLLFFIMFSFYLYRQEKFSFAGIVLGIAVAIKLTPIFLLLFFLRKKAYKILLACIITFAFTLLLSYMFFGQTLLVQYFTQIFPHIPTIGNSSYYNQAFTGFLARSILPDTIAGIFNYGLLVLLLLTSFFLTKSKKQNSLSEFLEYGLFLTAILIAAGLSWQHHFVLLLLPFAALFVKHPSIFLFISYVLISYNIKNPEVYIGGKVLFLSHVLYGTVLLYILLVKQLTKIKKSQIK